jgi:hypothetical protein
MQGTLVEVGAWLLEILTSTWPSTSGPAPIPITGIVNLLATFLANSAGIFSKTSPKQPHSCNSSASSNNLLASASSLARTP